jgi:hypothetical protein
MVRHEKADTDDDSDDDERPEGNRGPLPARVLTVS